MQDYGRGVVIGQETYGKGSVQNLYPLDRFAIAKDRLRPAHRHHRHVLPVTGEHQNRGVQPDIACRPQSAPEEVGERLRDRRCPEPDYGRRASARRVSFPALADCRRNTAAVPKDPDFVYTRGRDCRHRGDAREKSVSLNLAERTGLSARAPPPPRPRERTPAQRWASRRTSVDDKDRRTRPVTPPRSRPTTWSSNCEWWRQHTQPRALTGRVQ